MNYLQSIEYIHSLTRFGIRPGLERVGDLCAALGNPQKRLRVIHVAGTNGKGSTCAMLAEICRAAGLRTGLYTSPYVTDFRERMQLDGAMIPEDDLARLTERCRLIIEKMPGPPTEFELVTAIAFAWFAERACDIVVLEVGLGGRLDATNLVEAPACSVITKIALDHTQVLGSSIGAIAAEKCGIIKAGCPVVSCCEQPPEALAVIRETAERLRAPLSVPTPESCVILSSGLRGGEALLDGLRVHVPLIGEHMCRNALTAVRAARLLSLPDEAIAQGIASVKIPARMELISREPLLLLDGGHNPDGARALSDVLKAHLPDRDILLLCGMMEDKDLSAYLRIVLPHASQFIACKPKHPRALAAEALAACARRISDMPVEAIDDPRQALRHGLKLQAELPGAALLICGSFYLAGELRESLPRASSSSIASR
ncbi:MAG: bifunctional folylpolyglutamate synthase/dihydrofolate synthase [Oscillospiraceae bacterium]|nr:bifunctional folylpolyglutamate synthase/dihydrofolate synthase [Oscillospiraceae bacterium]